MPCYVDTRLPLCHQASRLACCPCGHAVSRMVQTPVVVVVLVVLSMGLALMCQATASKVVMRLATLDLPRPPGFVFVGSKQPKRQNLRSLESKASKPTPAFA